MVDLVCHRGGVRREGGGGGHGIHHLRGDIDGDRHHRDVFIDRDDRGDGDDRNHEFYADHELHEFEGGVVDGLAEFAGYGRGSSR